MSQCAVFVIEEVCYLCAYAMLQILFVFLSVGKTTEHQKLLFVLRYLFFGPNQEAVVNRLKLEVTEIKKKVFATRFYGLQNSTARSLAL